MQLVIQQMDSPEGPVFCVRNGVTSTKPVSLPDPSSYPVRGYDGKRLLKELAWYLEHYLEFPAGADAERAEAVVDTLQAWGGEVFDALFTQKAYAWYSAARANLGALEIKIESASPAVLSWPWEALYSGDDGYLARHCCMERQPPDLDLPLRDVPEETGELHVLFIVSRPDTEAKVGYHGLEREVIRYIRDNGRAVTVDVLRPPTFKRLRDVLRERPGYYHIVHFDGHGGYGPVQSAANAQNSGTAQSGGKANGQTVTIPAASDGPAKYQGMEGQLIFETDGAEAEAVGAEKLGGLLTQCGVPMMVLNACQSAMIDGQAGNPFASVAARLLKAGIPSVTAMGYSLYVSGAKQFVPAFYEALFQDGGPAGAMRSGRQAMYARPERPCYYGECPLQDWIVPELYQQIPAGARLLPKVGQAAARKDTFPRELRTIGDYGLIGRGKEIHDLERILQRNRQAGILIHGMAGAGKTTLAKGFLHWLRDTSGLREADGTDCPVFWFGFQDIHSVDAVFHPLADALLGETARTLDEADLLDALTDVLNRRRVYMVWDNFESASGIPGTEVAAFLPEKDRNALKNFLHALRGGKSRVFITSRQNEDWLSVQACARLETLGGLDGDERWDYCREVVRDLGLTIDKNDGDMKDLLNRLGGNPLALRAILLRLGEGRTARDLLKELDTDFTGAAGDAGTEQMRKAFRVLWSGMDPALSPVLQVIGLHEHYADADWVADILWQMDDSTDPKSPEAQAIRDRVTRCFQILENAGLCTDESANIWKNLYRLHPALRGVLAREYPAGEDVRRWFVRYLAYQEQEVHNDPAQHGGLFDIYEDNFLYAKTLAEELEMRKEDLLLTWGLAFYANDRSRNALALDCFEEMAEKAHRYDDFDIENRAYGLLASNSSDPERKRFWSQKAADMWKNTENLSAYGLYKLGTNAREQGGLTTAVEYYKRALTIWEREGDSRAAKEYLMESVRIAERINNGVLSAANYNALGNISGNQGDFTSAKLWFAKAADISEKMGDTENAAIARRNLERATADADAHGGK